MKKYIMAIALACGMTICMGAADIAVVSTNEQTRIVKLTPQKWNEVKCELDTKGIVKLKESNVVLVITNGLPNVEHWFLDANMPINFGGYTSVPVDDKRKKPMVEPGGYPGQKIDF